MVTKVEMERFKSGITKIELANKVGISRNHMHQILSGGSCSDETKKKIADVLGKSVGYLFYNEKGAENDGRE